MNSKELESKKHDLFELMSKIPYSIEDALNYLKENKQIIYEDKKDEILIKFLKEKKFYLTYFYVEILQKKKIKINIGPLMKCIKVICKEESIKFYITDSKNQDKNLFKNNLLFEENTLCLAIKYNYSEDKVNFFISKNIDINKTGKDRNSPLLLTLKADNKIYSENFIKSLINEKQI